MSLATATAIEYISEVVARVTRILSEKQIEVIQQGMRVGVEYDREGAPTKVYLPSLSNNPPPELITAIQGFLDKEVSGLLYTDFKTRQKLRGREDFKGGMAKSLQDIIEDARTEREMKKEFRGSAANFNQVHDFAVREVISPKHAAEMDPNKRQANLALPAIRAAAGDLAYEEFMDDKWEELGNLGGAILHYAQDIRDCTTTEDSFNVTRKIIRKLEEMEGGGGGDGDGDDEEEDDGQGDGGGSGGDDEGEGQDDGSYDPNEDNSGKEARDPTAGSPGGRGGSPPHKFDDLDEAFDDSNFDKEMEKKIEKMALAEHTNEKYVPYSRQYDYVGPLPNIAGALAKYNDSRSAQKIMDESQKNSHVIQQQIQKLFMAKALVRWEPGLKKGKINPASLHKLRLGDSRVFRKRIESNSRDIAVSLVIDMSGSMHSWDKIDAACISALMFSQVLTNLNIAHEISSFTTYYGHYRNSALPKTADINKMMDEYSGSSRGVRYARVAPITNYILKGWGERLQEETKRSIAMIPSAYTNLMANNVDGESVELAGRRLLQRKENRKVMVVMSDGCPAADGDGRLLTTHLKSVVKELGASGVEMLGLGMMDDSVRQYYPKHEVVRQVDQIPTKILELTKHMVVGA